MYPKFTKPGEQSTSPCDKDVHCHESCQNVNHRLADSHLLFYISQDKNDGEHQGQNDRWNHWPKENGSQRNYLGARGFLNTRGDTKTTEPADFIKLNPQAAPNTSACLPYCNDSRAANGQGNS
jgi:hypothetical protein